MPTIAVGTRIERLRIRARPAFDGGWPVTTTVVVTAVVRGRNDAPARRSAASASIDVATAVADELDLRAHRDPAAGG